MNNHAFNWHEIGSQLDDSGCAYLKNLLSDEECRTLIENYDQEQQYRKRVVMQRHGYGQGEYRYFDYPLPSLVAKLRQDFYPPLAGIANDWTQKLSGGMVYPATLKEYTEFCHREGQAKATPLILKYEEGDYNRLHQDLYGEHLFPLQMVVLLSDPLTDFEGGEFILTEQRPRMQSRATVVPLHKGDAVVFAVNDRPVMGAKRMSRTKMRHGVSEVRSGSRYTLGIIFHDAA